MTHVTMNVLESVTMLERPLNERTVLITGAARRLGRLFALDCARAGADIVIHHGHSDEEAENVRAEITGLGRRAWVFKADLSDPDQARELVPQINESTPLHAFVNSAAIFESLSLEKTSIEDWERHLAINLTAPFILSQAFPGKRRAKEGGLSTSWIGGPCVQEQTISHTPSAKPHLQR